MEGKVAKKISKNSGQGAPVVLVSGCHIGDCHYIDANHWTQKKVQKLQQRMEDGGWRMEKLDIKPNRL